MHWIHHYNFSKALIMKYLLFLIYFINISGILGAPNDFTFTCPGDITISCTDNYSDLTQYGKAYTILNGEKKWVHDCKIVYNINDCGVGTITRTWGVEDPEWHWLTCSQVITLSNANAFGYADITWPLDINIESCNPAEDLKKLARPYDKPTWKTNKCSKPIAGYTDVKFTVNEGCMKIIRTWKILDWCVYDPYKYPTRGIFSAVQVIKLITIDTSAKIICKNNLTVNATKECGGAYVQIDTAAFISACNIPYRIYNTSLYSDQKGNDASGFYPNGKTTFYYIAEYGCGTEIKCEVTIQVNNKLQPTPYCLTGVIVDLMPIDSDNNGTVDAGMVDVWASDLNKGSFHKCPKQKLRFSFSSDPNDRFRTFTCDDLGLNDIEMWVTDSLGNQDFCKTTITIQNNGAQIPDCKRKDSLITKRYQLSCILTGEWDKKRVTQIKIGATDMVNQWTSESIRSAQDEFAFIDLRNDHQYSLHIETLNSNINGLDAKDINTLEKLIAGTLTITNPYRLLAGDVNHDRVVNVEDVLLLKKIVAGQLAPRETYHHYYTLPLDYIFKNPLQPWDEVSQLNMTIEPHQDHFMQKNYLLVKTGDVDQFSVIKKKTKTEGISSNLLYSIFNSEATANQLEMNLQYLPESKMIKLEIPYQVNIQNIEIYNLNGQQIYHWAVDKGALNSGLYYKTVQASTSGIYIYRISGDEFVRQGKIFIGN